MQRGDRPAARVGQVGLDGLVKRIHGGGRPTAPRASGGASTEIETQQQQQQQQQHQQQQQQQQLFAEWLREEVRICK
ncbi:hypothetical protein PLESTB_001009900 [Pleodorina starrii]|uniref:Uncharacterized protein n=1 Tax=Pleodorina starrii TaxID=330485 RepID=A0A9W6BQC6_9CHLO|nr:hypothetical protein PLESTB_001009900 [Pleodorina starrii]